MATCKPKNQKYPITDAIAKAVIIDGSTTAVVSIASLAITSITSLFFPPKIIDKSGDQSAFKTTYKIAKMTIAYTVGAIPGYLIRIDARENDHQNIGGFMGGSTKYIVRSILNNDVADLKFKGALGGLNNLAYELCKDNEQCSGNILNTTIASVAIEAGESLVKSSAQSGKIGDITYGTTIGAFAGLVGASFANFVYAPNIENIHELVDSFYGYSSEFCPA